MSAEIGVIGKMGASSMMHIIMNYTGAEKQLLQYRDQIGKCISDNLRIACEKSGLDMESMIGDRISLEFVVTAMGGAAEND